MSQPNPAYSAATLLRADGSALGFAYNAPGVLKQIIDGINGFRTARNAAATQADVVVHSMGGVVSRATQLLPQFADRGSFRTGVIHKLVTIGTPHLGTPVATQLLTAGNKCIRDVLAIYGNVSLTSVTVNGASINGAVGDLQGDGFGGALSSALQAIGTGSGPGVPTAFISATATQSNLSGLDSSWTASYIRNWKCKTGTLAQSLTSAGWPTVFGQNSDAIVPLRSQVNGLIGSGYSGFVHSPGTELLGFNGPAELDAGSIPAGVIQLLNAPVSSGAFNVLP